MVARASLFASIAALAGLASAQLQVTVPGGPNLWWIEKSQNNIFWTCKQSPAANFTILLANSNPAILVAPQAVIAIEKNEDCSKTLTPEQTTFKPATGYTVLLANPLNNTDVYATSQPFEIKALGAAYPASSATPTDSGPTSSGASGATGASAGASPSQTKNAAVGSNAGRLGAGVVGVVVAAAAFAL